MPLRIDRRGSDWITRPGSIGPVLLQPGHLFPSGVAQHQRRLVAGLQVAVDHLLRRSAESSGTTVRKRPSTWRSESVDEASSATEYPGTVSAMTWPSRS